ncbi:MAG: molybdopterin-dependent oxidoreductase [Chloroflexi bacterium]|nr:molybdopterin-dependent oxidoreductase [Chloroflexota bacterium]
MSDYSVVGSNPPRVDALEKVTGAARYAGDVDLSLPTLLYGRVLRSPHAHAKIVSIDTSRAEKLPGIRAVLTGSDAPSVRFGLSVADRHLLCRDTVRYVGDSVAAVAADSPEAAEEALDLIRVAYEVLPAIHDPEEAMKPDCPVVVHPDLANYERPRMAYVGLDLPGPNVHTHHKIRRGDVEEGFRRADLIVERRYSTPRVVHAQMEPYNAYGYVDADGTLTIWTSMHQLFSVIQYIVCKVFSLPPSKVRVRARYVGGNFGGQAQPEWIAALLALKTGRPVRVDLTREECFVDSLSQQPMITYVVDGVARDGRMLARKVRVISNSGASATYAPQICRNGAFALSSYRVPNLQWDSYGVYTNEPVAGAFRGFGVPPVTWALEQQMDIIARELGIDPVEFRKRNVLREGEENVRGEIIEGTAGRECLDRVAEQIEWGTPCPPTDGTVRRGKGLALGIKHSGADTFSGAVVKVRGDGTIEAYHGGDEVGQGANTVLAQMVAEEFRTTTDVVRLFWGDTAAVPYDFGAVASRQTFTIGNAMRLACMDAKRQLFELAASRLECAPQDLDIASGRVFVKGSREKEAALSELFVGGTSGQFTQAGEIIGKGTYTKRTTPEDPETGQGKTLVGFYTYGAQAVEVAVDTESGQVTVLRVVSAFDAGQPISPVLCEGQIEGGLAMGIGSALYEEVVTDRGKVGNPNFADYHVPTVGDIPVGHNSTTMLEWAPQRDGPFKAKGIGESTLVPTAAAVGNAIHAAVGVRIKDLPITAERVLAAIKELSGDR